MLKPQPFYQKFLDPFSFSFTTFPGGSPPSAPPPWPGWTTHRSPGSLTVEWMANFSIPYSLYITPALPLPLGARMEKRGGIEHFESTELSPRVR